MSLFSLHWVVGFPQFLWHTVKELNPPQQRPQRLFGLSFLVGVAFVLVQISLSTVVLAFWAGTTRAAKGQRSPGKLPPGPCLCTRPTLLGETMSTQKQTWWETRVCKAESEWERSLKIDIRTSVNIKCEIKQTEACTEWKELHGFLGLQTIISLREEVMACHNSCS